MYFYRYDFTPYDCHNVFLLYYDNILERNKHFPVEGDRHSLGKNVTGNDLFVLTVPSHSVQLDRVAGYTTDICVVKALKGLHAKLPEKPAHRYL